jgi:uncharacterized membrane protein
MTAPEVAVPRPRRVTEDFTTSLAWLRATRAGSAAADVARRTGGPRTVLTICMAISFAFFAVHIQWRHDRFGTFDHDLGIWDQNVWLLAHGEWFNTVRGLDVFAFHVSPALYLFVPFYWLGAGPNFLDLVMVAALTAGAIPIFRAATHHLRNEWQSVVVSLAFLVNYAGQWMLQETFHPEVMAITPLLYSYAAALERRWRAYALWLAFAVSWKEDVALAAFMLGLVLLIRRERRVGLATMLAAVAWFAIATRVIVPAFSDEGNFTEALFGDLGNSPTEIAETAATDPTKVYRHLETADAGGYARDLLASYGFIPLLSPLPLLIGLPQALINLLAIHNFFWTTRVHYAALPLTAMTIAMIEGVARPKRAGVRRFLLGLLAVSAVATSVSWGISWFSEDYRSGYWPLTTAPARQAVLEEAVTIPDADDRVAATYNLVPHLSHRSNIYTFPNPWKRPPQNWGVEGENPHDPETVDILIVDRATTNEVDAALADAILAERDWEIITDREGIVVARQDHDDPHRVDHPEAGGIIEVVPPAFEPAPAPPPPSQEPVVTLPDDPAGVTTDPTYCEPTADQTATTRCYLVP